MPKCHITGNEIDKLPKWLDDVNVRFRSADAADPSVDYLPFGGAFPTKGKKEGEDESGSDTKKKASK